MKLGSLFTGYGGLDMAVEAVFGATLAWTSDIDPGACRIIARRYPGVPNLGDITRIDWTGVEPVDVIAGGSPCQDNSVAGKRAGMHAGTRSGLWSHMRDAIAALHPAIVIWENPNGALSADGHSRVEPCPGCVGNPPRRALRASGRVVGDLASLGYDARWTVVSAASVGACHLRQRVFLVATDAARIRRDRAATQAATGWPGPADGRREPVTLLPTPNASTFSTTNSTTNSTTGRTPTLIGMAERRHLPTPRATRGGSATETMSTGIAAELSSTDRSDTSHGTEGGPGEILPGLRSADEAEALWRTTGGPVAIPGAQDVLQVVRKHEGERDFGHPALAGEEGTSGDVCELWNRQRSTRPPHRPGPGEQRLREPGDALCVLPPEVALGRGSGQACGCDAWGRYAPAVHQWEVVLGRPAPEPSERGPRGTPRLSARAVEWMMGLPDGWVTGVPGVTRTQALRALGNGVVPQQADAALRYLVGAEPGLERGAA